MQHPRSLLRKASSAVLLLALLAAAAASVSARPSKQLLGDHHDQASSMASTTPLNMPSSMNSKHAVITSLLSAKFDKLEAIDMHHKQHKKHEGKSSHLPLAVHMDEHIPAAAMPNPSNPPMTLPNPSQPPMMPQALPAVDTKHTKLSKHEKKAMKAARLAAAAHIKFDHDKKDKHDKFDHHNDLPMLQMPALPMPNPSQPPMIIMPAADEQHIKLSKHEKKAMKAARLAAAAHIKFDHDKKDKHDKFDHHNDLPMLQMPALPMPNPSQPPMIIMPAADEQHTKLSKHEKKAMKAARLAAAAHIKFDHDKKDKQDKFDHHDDLPMLQMPALSMPNPSQPPMIIMPAADEQHIKLSKHEKKAMKAAAQLAAAAHIKFDHDKKDKHDKFDHELPAVLVNPNPSNPPMSLPNPSQPPMMPHVLPAADVKHSTLSKHETKALKKAAQFAAAAGVKIDQVAGVSVADVVMRNEPRFEGPTTLG